METILVISFNGFSETNANGKTLQALLSDYGAENLLQFYRGNEKIDFAFARSYFHVTDKEMLKSFFMKRPAGVYTDTEKCENGGGAAVPSQSAALSSALRKHNYNFLLRWTRELLWCIAPWGKKKFFRWLDEQNPKAIVYMVGESIFEDRLVCKIAKRKNIPVVLYNCEGYRLVDLQQRHGVERLFYRTVERSYRKLQKRTSLVIYNCQYLKRKYQQKYTTPENATIALNAAAFDTTVYGAKEKETLSIAYFGNLGVGRVPSLLQVADTIHHLRPGQKIDVYGSPSQEDAVKLGNHPAIVLRGFVNQETLQKVRENADILLHVESFDSQIVPKLKNAFSTKIAQCLCSGRALFTYAPKDMASTEYLLSEGCACAACSQSEMEQKMQMLLTSATLRKKLADQALSVARQNHDLKKTAQRIRTMIGATYES